MKALQDLIPSWCAALLSIVAPAFGYAAASSSQSYSINDDVYESGGASYAMSYANYGTLSAFAGTSSATIPDGSTFRAFHGFVGQLEPPLFPTTDLVLVMAASPEAALVGETLTYSILATNAGPEAVLNAVVTVEFPANLKLTSGSLTQGTYSEAGSTVTCSLGRIETGASVSITITGTPTQAGLVFTTATAFGRTADSNPSNNRVESTVPVLNVITWSGKVNSDWFVAGNWLPAAIPGSSDVASLSSDSNIELNSNASVGGLILTKGTLNGTGTLTIGNRGTWSRGTLACFVNILPTARFTITGPAAKAFGRTIVNRGTIVWEGSGGLECQATLQNLDGAIFEVHNDAPIYISTGWGSPPHTFSNSGIFRKTSGTGTNVIGGPGSVDVFFDNTGRVEIQTGTLSIASGGTGNGVFDVTAGATVTFPLGNYTFNSNTIFSGSGKVLGNGANLTMNGNIFSQNFELAGSQLTGTFTNIGTIHWTSGGLGAGGQVTITNGSQLLLEGPAPKGLYGMLINRGTIVWGGTGGIDCQAPVQNLDSGLFEVRNDAPMYIPTGAGLPPRTFSNSGMFRKTSGTGTNVIGGPGSVDVFFNNTGRIEIQTGTLSIASGGTGNGVFDVRTGAAIIFPSGNYTFNSGTILSGLGKVLGNGANLTMNGNIFSQQFELAGSQLTGTFTNIGTIRWTSGGLGAQMTITNGSQLLLEGPAPKGLYGMLINRGTILWGGTGGVDCQAPVQNLDSGLFEVRNDAPLYITIGAGLPPRTFSNNGIFRKTGGTGTNVIGGPGSVDVFFNNTGRVEIQAGTLSVASGGTGNGVFDVTAGAALIFPSGNYIFDSGTIFAAAGVIRAAGASVTMNGTIFSQGFELSDGQLTGTFTNVGTMHWTGGRMAGGGQATFNASGSVLSINGSADKVLESRGFYNYGTIFWRGTGSLVWVYGGIENRRGGLFTVENDSALWIPQGAGLPPRTFINQGTFRKSGSLGATTFGGPGSIEVLFSNPGTLDVRSGTLVLGNGLKSYATSVLRTTVNGMTPGTNFGRVVAGATAELNGTLEVVLTNNFKPVVSNSFEVVSGPISGAFVSLVGKSIGNGLYFEAAYKPEAVVLSAQMGQAWFNTDLLSFSNGHFTVSINGVYGRTCIVEGSTNLEQWVPVSTNLLNGNPWDFVDSSANAFRARMYRLRLLP